MKPRRTFSFDGFGINGPDKHRTRLATFTGAGLDYPGLGPLLEAAPELLEALRELMSYTGGWDSPVTHPCGKAAAVLKRLENLK